MFYFFELLEGKIVMAMVGNGKRADLCARRKREWSGNGPLWVRLIRLA